MPFKDFDVYWVIAQGILRGADAYSLPEAYYPLPFYYIFLPLAALPLPVAHIIWTAIEAAIFVAILRGRAVVTLLFMPVLLTFLMGQILMPMLGLFALLRTGLYGGIALALLMLKPQLVLFLAPWQLWQWWRTQRPQLAWFFGLGAVLLSSAFLVQPNWLARWLTVSGQRLRAVLSPSLWGVLAFLPQPIWILAGGSLTVILVLWAWRRGNFDLIGAVSLLVNPVIISYDLTLLTVMVREPRTWIFLTLLSWVTFAISAYVLNEGAAFLLTLAVIVILLKRSRPQLSPKMEKDAYVSPTG